MISCLQFPRRGRGGGASIVMTVAEVIDDLDKNGLGRMQETED